MNLNIVAIYTDRSVSVVIPDQFRAEHGEGRATLRFASVKDASRYFSKLARKSARAHLNERYGQAKLDANLMPIHTPQGKLRMESKVKHYKTFAQR